jgi:hypothetical protein
MDEMSLPERESEQKLFQHMMAQYDTPAFARRALRIQEVLHRLLARCRQQRAKWFVDGRLVMEELAAQLSGWDVLRQFLAEPEQGDLFPHLQELLSARAPFRSRTASNRRVRWALKEMIDWLQRFNQRWQTFLRKQDLGPLNELRDGYNRYYVLEKECAMRSARLARHGFEPMAPYTMQDLLTHFPLLPIPQAIS